ncbi:hypothetical protein O1D74_003545 [Vibrio cholerae]|nr:hypothetical protein [Vibrio cholerae]
MKKPTNKIQNKKLTFTPKFSGNSITKKIGSCKGCGGNITFAISVALS